jgi:hypothetical protein
MALTSLTPRKVLSGAKPWKGVRDFVVLSRVAKGAKPERRDYASVPAPVWEAITPCWSTEPQSRPSIREVSL